jgi:hypothetical protein
MDQTLPIFQAVMVPLEPPAQTALQEQVALTEQLEAQDQMEQQVLPVPILQFPVLQAAQDPKASLELPAHLTET